MMAAMEFRWPVRVYIEDTDAGGIVYYVNYLKYMERARTEFLRHLGFDHARMLQQGQMFVIHSSQVRYLEPAKLDDELSVSVRVTELKRTHLTFAQNLYRADRLLTEAALKAVCVQKDSMKPCAIPTEMVHALQTNIG